MAALRTLQESALALLGHIERLMAGNVAATNRGHIQVTIPNKGPLGLLLGNQKAGMPDMAHWWRRSAGWRSSQASSSQATCFVLSTDWTRLASASTRPLQP